MSNKDFYVHRLVASEFIRKINDKEEVNHIDGDKSNNVVSNLEICTRCENQEHAYINNLNKRIKPPIKIMINGKKYNSLGEASRDINISAVTLSNRIRDIKNGINRKYYKKDLEIELINK